MKVFLTSSVGVPHSLLFDMSSDWDILIDSNAADAIVIVDSRHPDDYIQLTSVYRPYQVIIVLNLFHMDDHYAEYTFRHVKDYYKEITSKIVIAHANSVLINNPKFVFFDQWFNQEKLYCTEYNTGVRLDSRLWTYYCNKEIYDLHPIKKTPLKKFLAPMRVYEPSDLSSTNYTNRRMKLRSQIRNLLESFGEVSYISNPGRGNALLPASSTPDVTASVDAVGGGSWYPVSYNYYNSSIVSVYTETITSSNNAVGGVTEKTFDPLIRGNFILPFAQPGLINELISRYGFKFPTWIDYSYDNIIDDDQRFNAYTESILKLNQYSLDQLFDMALDDISILEYNRSIFFTRPYDNLYALIKNCIKTNELNNWEI
jgi:hypothetical protein